jgi:type II secretion system protein N
MRSRLKNILGCALYCAVLALALFVWKFPYPSLGPWIERQVRERTGQDCAIDGLHAEFPTRLVADRLTVRTPRGETALVADNVAVAVHPWPILLGNLAADFQTDVCDGSVQGSFTLDWLPRPANFGLDLTLAGIKLERSPALTQAIGAKVSGVLAGSAELTGRIGAPVETAGPIRLSLKNGQIPLDSQLLRLRELTQGRIETSLRLSRASLKIESCQFEARGLKGSLTGAVELKPAILQSILSVSGSAAYDPDYFNPLGEGDPSARQPVLSKTLPFKIAGPASAPAFSPS